MTHRLTLIESNLKDPGNCTRKEDRSFVSVASAGKGLFDLAADKIDREAPLCQLQTRKWDRLQLDCSITFASNLMGKNIYGFRLDQYRF